MAPRRTGFRRPGGRAPAAWLALAAALLPLVGAAQDTDLPAPPTHATVTFRLTVPESTPAADAIHIAGDFQGWNPGHPSYRLEREGPSRWITRLELPRGPVQFKFTRGSWGTVEKGPRGEEIANREFRVSGPDTLDLTVAAWADGGLVPPPRASTTTGNVTSLSFPDVLDGRRIWVWLPPGYEESDTRYPVLYFWDGQNVFDDATSFSGEWRVDETCTRLIREGRIRPLIVVGVENGGEARIREYTPWADGARGGGDGMQHLTRLAEEVKPRIDATFRTLPDAENTGICGSSLGGLMAVYAGLGAPGTFGRAAGLSVSFQWADHALARWARERAAAASPGRRLYFDTGTMESGRTVDRDNNGTDDHVDALRQLERILRQLGYRDDAVRTVVDEGGRHHESAWARRFPEVVEYLFPAE